MGTGYRSGDVVYIIENGRKVREATVLRVAGEFHTLRLEGGGGVRLRGNRLYATRGDAEAVVENNRRNRFDITRNADGYGDFDWQDRMTDT